MAYELDHEFENKLKSTITHEGLDMDEIRIKEAKVDVTVPTNYTINHEGFDDVCIKITQIPRILMDSNLKTENEIRIKEIPEVRAHVPMNFNFGVKLFGLEFLVFSLCGEMQVITEKYKPNKWELCEDPTGDS